MPRAAAPDMSRATHALLALAGAALLATLAFLASAWVAVADEAVAAWQHSRQQAVSAQAAHLGISLGLLQAVADGVDTRAMDIDDPDAWARQQVQRHGAKLPGVRVVVQDGAGRVLADSMRGGPDVSHPHPLGLSRSLEHCAGCEDNGFLVAAATADRDGLRASAMVAPVTFSEVLREPWSWVVDAHGQIVAHADPYQVGTRPFDAAVDDPALTRMRRQMAAGVTGSATYTWAHDDGEMEQRLAAFAPIPGGPVGWSVATSDTRSAAFRNVDRALRVMAGGTAAAVLMAMLLALLVYIGQRRASAAREALVQERVTLTQAAAHSERLAMLGTMTAGVAHDLRSPLSALQISIELLQEGDLAPEERDEIFEDAGLALDRLRRFSGDLTRFSRGPDDSDRSSDPARCGHMAVRLLGPRVRSGKDLRVSLPALPRVGIGEQRLSQVLMNLLDNAAQVADRIDLTGALCDGGVELWVDDAGPGLDPRVATTVFDAFVTTKPAGEGTGLGLFLCRRFVEEAGGSIVASRGPLGGARFTVRLPVAQPVPVPDARPSMAS